MPAKNNKIPSTFNDDSDEEVLDFDSKKIDELFKNYDIDSSKKDLERITRFFEDGENNDCLICIRQMKSKDKIWSCTKCYCPFHLLCIQKWANDSIAQKKMWQENQPQGYYTTTGDYVEKKKIEIEWDCPFCRKTYETNEIPRHYFCYCAKERDPKPQSFLIPHSCGEICDKQLECKHRCRLLCHPGSCPSCPVVIQTSCKCKKSNLKSIRCSQGSWSCNMKCQKVLRCGHKCEDICHDSNECPPCPKSTKAKCVCGKQEKSVKCRELDWNCGSTCGKLFPCQQHSCEQKCHDGDCAECPYGLNQSCFCGKQILTSTGCDKLVRESCGNTCLKTMSCEAHKCLERCHKGECSSCLEIVKKKCRCGNIEKDFACSKELFCETKCKNIKSCKKHHCNRKCCIDCSPCDKVCMKTLNCGKHKCAALCHDGPCYPCTEKSVVKCRCMATQIVVKCGKKNVKTPNCRQPCKFNTKKCHHDPIPHKCHNGDCPSCVQICDVALPCDHLCLAKCHDNVKIITKDKNYVPQLPGEVAAVKVKIMKLEHPPCSTKVSRMCLGEHVNNEFSCHEAKVVSCGRLCGRPLRCLNHTCKIPCHEIKNETYDDCEDCNELCSFPRPGNCNHPCPRGMCHSSTVSCKRCSVMIKEKCYCGLTEVYYKCSDVNKKNTTAEEIEILRAKFLCCGSKCIKNYACGHQCQTICHKGKCPGADECKKKVKITCACKTRRGEFTCKKIRDEKITVLECDEKCEENKKRLEQEMENQRQKQRELEEEKNRKELEEYEKMFGKKKYKERRTKVVTEEKDGTMKKILIGLSLTFLIAAVSVGFFMSQ